MSTCESKIDGKTCSEEVSTMVSCCHQCFKLMTNGSLYVKNFGTKSEVDYMREIEALQSKLSATGVLSMTADLKKMTDERDRLAKEKVVLEAIIAAGTSGKKSRGPAAATASASTGTTSQTDWTDALLEI